ncbi:photosystem I reaction center subunit XII [Scytonema sp. NUACC26]
MSIANLLYLAEITSISDTQVFIALIVALIPGVLAWRLAASLYNS